MSRNLRILLGAASLLAAAACTPAAPSTSGQVTSVEPASSPVGAPVKVTVVGSGFTPILKQDLGDAQPQVAEQVSVQVDNQPVDTTFANDAQLTITMPANLAPGQHTITATRGGSQLAGSVVYTGLYPITAAGSAISVNVGQTSPDTVQLTNAAAVDMPVQVTASSADSTIAVELEGSATLTVPAQTSVEVTVSVTGSSAGSATLKLTVAPQLPGVDLAANDFTFAVTVNGLTSSGSSGSTSSSSSSSSSTSNSGSSSGSSTSTSSSSSSSGSTTSSSSSSSSTSTTTSSSSSSSSSTTTTTGSSSSSASSSSSSSSSSGSSGSTSTSGSGSGSGSSTGSTGGGCTQASDCDVNMACDLTTHTCGLACTGGTDSYSDCNTGCCDPNVNACVNGQFSSACGDTGMCAACGPGTGGLACLNGSVCGCAVATDCGLGTACDTTSHTCGTACGTGHTACNGSGYLCNAGSCVNGCSDGQKDGNETDTDCGGPDCTTKCGDTKNCNVGSDCQSGSCQGGVCAEPLTNGATCQSATDCQSGFCVSGVCCGAKCNGSCQACSNALTGQPNGTCANVNPGTPDPAHQCADQGQFSCGHDGTCGAGGTCAFYSSGTVCGPASCSGGDLTGASTCNGTGVCTNGTTSACAGNFICQNATSCETTCGSDDTSGDSKCATGFWCDGSDCQAPQASGATCDRASQCTSGSCGVTSPGQCD